MPAKDVAIRTLFISLGAIVLLGLGTALVYRGQAESRLSQARQRSSEELVLYERALDIALSNIGEIVLLLAGQNELLDYLETQDREDWHDTALEYLHVAQTYGDFDQVRFIDASGMEVIRIDYCAGSPEIIPPADLQDKSTRYYVQETLPLECGVIYVSALDLNVERDVIEVPYKPMLRFGTCVCDRLGRKRGMIILNYLADHLLRLLEEGGSPSDARTMLVNAEGYWLKGLQAEDEWGFMLESRADRTLTQAFPEAARRIALTESGQFRTGNGLFTFRTLYPAKLAQTSATSGVVSAQGAGHWKIISYVSPETIAVMLHPVRSTWMALFAGGSAIAIPLAFVYSRLRLQQARARRRIEFLATRDPLTGTHNRHYFEERIHEEVARATRSGHSIAFLMIDITRFKQINDAYGHAEGDRVLKQVAAILLAGVRASDIVVRYGGDEFLVMLPESSNETEPARARIDAAIAATNESSRFEFPIVLAIGAAVWDPDSVHTIDDALRLADQRMYAHKELQHDEDPASPD